MNKLFAGLFFAAAFTIVPPASNNPPPLIASVPFAARAAHRKVTAMTNYGTFEGFPAIWDSGSDYGFVLYHDRDGWCRIPSYELGNAAGVMTKSDFDKAFPNLPSLAKLAS